MQLNLSVAVLGRGVPGYGVFGTEDISANLRKNDLALYLMMQYGVHRYSDFARQ